jgi:hypothetical protein
MASDSYRSAMVPNTNPQSRSEISIPEGLKRLQGITLDEVNCVKLMNRVEIKYLFMSHRIHDLISMLPPGYRILEIENTRALPYFTTYFDTPDFLFYHQHIHGRLNRYKIRYRKYEVTDESFLEIKKKNKKGRTIKWRIENRPEGESLNLEAEEFLNHYSPVRKDKILPVLLNRFNRITLADCSLKERITIDINVSFEDPYDGRRIDLPHLAIAELKKEGISGHSPFTYLIRQMGIHPTGFSKYCIGSALMNDTLKKNILKPKILLINKFENEYTRSAVIA